MKHLVIGVSTRALFNLEYENEIFETKGVAGYREYQIENENTPLSPGPAFSLVKALLNLNSLKDERIVEVIIMSRNSSDTSLRIFNTIKYYNLDITRAALTSGERISSYLKAFETDLFLSANEEDVQLAINDQIAAGLIYTNSLDIDPFKEIKQIRIAFDGDAVLFSDESERVYKKSGLKAFQEHEESKKDLPLDTGPFASFLMKLSDIQKEFANIQPIRTALVTARNAPAHERVIKTLRKWNILIDESFFLGGLPKKQFLKAFGAHIFFDDQRVHTDPSSEVVPSALVPYKD